MWQKVPKKTIFTLNIDGYAPQVTELTFPLIKAYADKIQADFYIIKDRKFPGWPPVYEKFQIYQLAQEMQNDWNIYIDADALIHPDLVDFTVVLPRDTVAHHGQDFAPIRWRYDRFFRRDGRHIGSGNWFTLGSDWCIELWKPLDDLTMEEAFERIFPTVDEDASGVIPRTHLVDDFTCSRNIAKYGLKFTTVRQLMKNFGFDQGTPWFWHAYTIPIDAKVEEMKKVLKGWKLT
jgi:hypothetical protein